MALRKKVVLLETAEADKERMRKEMTRLKRNMQEEQSKFELDFMNQLSDVVRENAMHVEVLTDELRQSKEANRSLSEQLKRRGTNSPQNDTSFQQEEVDKLKADLQDAEKSRDNLTKKLKESTRLFNDLKRSRSASSAHKRDSEGQRETEISRLKDENRSLKKNVESLKKENSEIKKLLKARQTLVSESSEKDTRISELEKEIQNLKNSVKRVESESRDLKDCSRNDNRGEQIRELGRTLSQDRGSYGIRDTRTSQIVKRLEENFKVKNEKEKSSLGKRDLYLELQKESKISDLEAELSSTRDLLKLEQDNARKQEKVLNSKLEALRDTLNNAEISRTALTLDKERLVAQTNGISEEKMEWEEKSKRQHEQLRQLQKLVEKHLKEVDKNQKNDEIEIQTQRDQVESLKRELQHSKHQVSQLKKTIQKAEKAESTAEHLVKLNLQSLQTQLGTLQKQLKSTTTELSEVQRKHKKEIDVLEHELDSSRLELRECVDARDKEIEKLKNLAEEKVNEARALERGKEQLILSMQDMVKNRRDEVDDYQNEIVEMNNRLVSETRKVSTLRSRLEQSDYPAKEIGKLRKRIADLSRQLSASQKENTNSNSSTEIRELKRKLKEALTQRSMLEDKLQNLASDRGNSSKPVQVLRERNAALKGEVERLTRQLQKVRAHVSRNEMQPYVVSDGVTRMMI